jgi:hypothetical protein
MRPTEDRRHNNLADDPTPHGLLQKGADFIRFIERESEGTMRF